MVENDRTTCRQRRASLLDFSNEKPQDLFGGTQKKSVISIIDLKPRFLDKGLIEQAIINAAKNVKNKNGTARKFLKDIPFYVDTIYRVLDSEKYEVGKYRDVDIVAGGKDRTISILPFFDKCMQHLVKLVTEEYIMRPITRDAYSCLPGRGVTSRNKTYNLIVQMQRLINTDRNGCKYHLEMDIKKFYPSLQNDVVLGELFKVIKCPFTRRLLYKLVMAYPRMPIGDPISQLLINLVMGDLDHVLREKMGVKNLFRFTDNIWTFGADKQRLHYIRSWIGSYLEGRFKLSMKENYQLKKTEDGVNCCGYRIFPGYIKIKTATKKKYIKAINKPKSLASYLGQIKHCNCVNLRHKIEVMKNKKVGEKLMRDFVGRRVDFTSLVASEIIIVDFEKVSSTRKPGDFFYKMQIIRNLDGKDVIEHTSTGSEAILHFLDEKTSSDLPLRKTVRKDSRGIYFEGTVVSDEETLALYKKQYNI